MFFTFILCNGTERFFMEYIKLNPRHCIGGICLTQAQYISILFILAGITGLSWLYTRRRKQKHAETNISGEL
jgi:phosphatidylglycerol:prolipoprotein diacylglycerol transferase